MKLKSTTEKRCRAAAKEILDNYSSDGSWYSVYRSLYKYTACGPSIGVLFRGMSAPVYCERLCGVGRRRLALRVYVSSIVEGVDQCTGTHVIDLGSFQKPALATEALALAVKSVDKEATEIWNSTHGCDECAEMHGYCDGFQDIAGYDGITPVHPDCKKCCGQGVVI